METIPQKLGELLSRLPFIPSSSPIDLPPWLGARPEETPREDWEARVTPWKEHDALRFEIAREQMDVAQREFSDLETKIGPILTAQTFLLTLLYVAGLDNFLLLLARISGWIGIGLSIFAIWPLEVQFPNPRSNTKLEEFRENHFRDLQVLAELSWMRYVETLVNASEAKSVRVTNALFISSISVALSASGFLVSFINYGLPFCG